MVELLAAGGFGLDAAQSIDARFDRRPFDGVFRALRHGPWKYILNPDGREELYHVVDDPHEINNRIATHRPIAERLAEELRKWLATAQPYRESGRPGLSPVREDDTRRRLRDLGYVQ